MSTPRPATTAVTAVLLVLTALGVPATAHGAARSADPDRFAARVVAKVNAHRATVDLATSRPGRCADRFAASWARAVHTGHRLPSPRSARRRCGGYATAVAVKHEPGTPGKIVREWTRTDAGSRALANPRVRRIGVHAIADRRGRWTVVVVLTGRKPAPGTGPAAPDPQDTADVPDPATTAARFRAGIVAATNAARAAAGVAPLTVVDCADTYAADHAETIVETGAFEHSDLADLIEGCEAWFVGENLLTTWHTGGQQAVQVWLDSPPHRANLLNPEFTHLGVGVALDPATDRWYAVQEFVALD